MTTGQNILKWTAIVTVCLTSVTFSLLSMRKPWVKPLVPGVRLSPTRPILRPEDVDPNGAFGKLQEAFNLLDKAGMDRAFEEGIHEAAKGDPTNAEVEAALLTLEPGLILVREAVKIQTGRQVPYVPDPNAENLCIEQACGAFRILDASARNKAALGHLDDAIDDILTSCEIETLVGTDGPMLSMFMNIAVIGGSCSTLTELSWRHDVPQSRYRPLLDVLTQNGMHSNPLPEMFRYQAAFMSNSIDEVLNGTGLGLVDPKSLWWHNVVFVGVVLGSDASTIRNSINCAYSHLIDTSLRSSTIGDIDAGLLVDDDARSSWRSVLYRDPMGCLLSSLFLFPEDMIQERVFVCRFKLRATCVALALDQFEQEHGTLPSALEQLVPRWLEKIPEDPFRVGKPLLYKALPDRNWAIYSVGTNGVDDGGVTDDYSTTTPDVVLSTRQFVAETNSVGP